MKQTNRLAVAFLCIAFLSVFSLFVKVTCMSDPVVLGSLPVAPPRCLQSDSLKTIRYCKCIHYIIISECMTTVKEHYHHHSLTDGLFLGLKCILSHKQGPWESDKDFGPEQKANKDKFHHSSSTAAPEPEKEDLL